MSSKIVFASSNVGKQAEIQRIFADLPWTVVCQSDLGVEDVPETGLSFIENAILKARHACQQTGLPAFSDDSGLEVDALDGAPGVYSARYAGAAKNFEANIDQVLSDLSAVPESERTARFRCVLVWMLEPNHPSPKVFEGSWEGLITLDRRGQQGFGYDPIFYVPDQGCTAAEMDDDLKASLSHRGQALRLMIDCLKDIGV